MNLALFLLLAADPVFFYSKSFPGSFPPYTSLTIKADGTGEYREAKDEETPSPFKLRPTEVEQIHALAKKLDYFDRTIESGLKVAKMGDKTFRWEQDGQVKEQVFNYTQDLDAQALHEWCEKIVESQQLYFAFERAVKHDKLGVNQAILRIEAAWDRRRLVCLEQFLPLLNRVAKSSSYLNMARDRAVRLQEVIQATLGQAAL
ncbi:MAG: hypothetical protein MUC42_14595 [Bryobacter sp.]|nr:hypothetical protein [Bryobacter sp.]